MIKILLLLFLGIFMCLPKNSYSQDRKYMYLGMEIENFRDLTPLDLIITDYNYYHQQTDIKTLHKLTLPFYIRGFLIGTKIHARFSEFGGNVHFSQFSTLGQGTNADGLDYYNKLTVSHNGFHLHYRMLFINTNFFRMGPGIGYKVEQFRARINYENVSSFNAQVPANKALMSGQVNFNISVGGPRFNMDIGVFYQIPFWNIDLAGLNSKLNSGFETTYIADQLMFKPVLYGVSLCIGRGAKNNYDF